MTCSKSTIYPGPHHLNYAGLLQLNVSTVSSVLFLLVSCTVRSLPGYIRPPVLPSFPLLLLSAFRFLSVWDYTATRLEIALGLVTFREE